LDLLPDVIEWWALCHYRPEEESYDEFIPLELPKILDMPPDISYLNIEDARRLLNRLGNDQKFSNISRSDILNYAENTGSKIFGWIYSSKRSFSKVLKNKGNNLTPGPLLPESWSEWISLFPEGRLPEFNKGIAGATYKEPRYNALGRTLQEYRALRKALVPGITEYRGAVLEPIQPMLKALRNKFNKSKSQIGRLGGRREDFIQILPYTLLVSALLEQGNKLLKQDSVKDPQRFEREAPIFELEYEGDPLGFWEALGARLAQFYKTPLPIANETVGQPKLTPSCTREQHATAWGYDSAKSAARIFRKVWETDTSSEGIYRSLNVELLFPLIQKFRQNMAKPGWNWRVPKTPGEILDMYEKPREWEKRM